VEPDEEDPVVVVVEVFPVVDGVVIFLVVMGIGVAVVTIFEADVTDLTAVVRREVVILPAEDVVEVDVDDEVVEADEVMNAGPACS